MKSTSGLSIWPEELPGVGRQRLDVAALALGEDRVEGQAGLARAGQPGEDDQRVSRQVERDVLEVVLARATDDEAVGHGGPDVDVEGSKAVAGRIAMGSDIFRSLGGAQVFPAISRLRSSPERDGAFVVSTT